MKNENIEDKAPEDFIEEQGHEKEVDEEIHQ
jgi:hypothetical protein